MSDVGSVPGSEDTLALDRQALHQVLEAITKFLIRQGFRRDGAAVLPEQEAAILALAIIAIGASDSETIIPKFPHLIIPVLATTPQEIEALSHYVVSEAKGIIRQLFRSSTSSSAMPLGSVPTATLAVGVRERTAVQSNEFRMWPVGGDTPVGSASEQSAIGQLSRSAQSGPSRLLESARSLAIFVLETWKQLLSSLGFDTKLARLVRKSLSAIGPKFSLILSGAAAQSANVRHQRRTATTLASWEDAGSYGLDLRRTVEATIAHGGLFRPKWRPIRRRAGYLFLVQALGLRDLEQARLQLLFYQLAAAGARVASYFYLSDPRQLRDFSGAGDGTFRTVDLATIADRHPYSRLAIISTGHELLHPFTHRPMTWTKALMAWPHRDLLTPLPERSWSKIETALQERLQFSVRAATRQSLRDISAAVGVKPAAQTHSIPSGDDMQGIVGISDLRYVTNFAPPAPEQTELIARLRAYLGDRGFRWLALCACYPELNLDLTILLRALIDRMDLTGDNGDDEDLLARLISLSWFRHGFLPVWLRRLIMSDLPRRQRLALRRSIAEMLATARFAQLPKSNRNGTVRAMRAATDVVLPLWHERGSAADTSQFDAVTIDFLTDGPTRDIDPLLGISPESTDPATEPQSVKTEISDVTAEPRIAAEQDHAAAPATPDARELGTTQRQASVAEGPRGLGTESSGAMDELRAEAEQDLGAKFQSTSAVGSGPGQYQTRAGKRLRVLISSPGDVQQERLRAELIIDKLSQDYSRFFTIEFLSMGE